MMPSNYYKKCAKIFPNFHVAHRWVPAGLESWLTPAAPLSGARIRALKAAAAAAAHIVLWLLQIANYNNHGNLKTPQHECFVNAEVWNEDIKHWTPFQIPSWIRCYWIFYNFLFLETSKMYYLWSLFDRNFVLILYLILKLVNWQYKRIRWCQFSTTYLSVEIECWDIWDKRRLQFILTILISKSASPKIYELHVSKTYIFAGNYSWVRHIRLYNGRFSCKSFLGLVG